MKLLILVASVILFNWNYCNATNPPKRLVSSGNKEVTLGQIVAGKGNQTNVGIRRVNIDSTISSVQELNVEGCEIFPNPCTDHASIVTTSPIESVRVSDLNGRIVDGCYSNGRLQFQTSGTFIVTVMYQNKKTETKTIVSIK
jgi:hypothetical protein